MGDGRCSSIRARPRHHRPVTSFRSGIVLPLVRMIEIRPYRHSDRPALSNIYLKCRLDTFSWVPKEVFDLSDFEKETEGEKILVTTVNSQPAGFISIWMQDHFIHHLFIDSDHQNKGLGKALLAEGLKIMGRPARLKCVIQNAKACRFYEKLGWKIENTIQEGPMGPYHNYVLIQ